MECSFFHLAAMEGKNIYIYIYIYMFTRICAREGEATAKMV